MSIHRGGKGSFGNSIFGEPRIQNLNSLLENYFEIKEEVYNIILCTENLKCILWKSRDGKTTKQPFLSSLGLTVTDIIYEVPKKFRNCRIEKYAVMPNHVHIILSLINEFEVSEPMQYVKNIPVYIKHQSEMLTGMRIWNDDHKCSRIKTRAEYDNIFHHTAKNMFNWESDCYFRII